MLGFPVVTIKEFTMKYIDRIIRDIRTGNNLDLYITVLAAITLLFLNIFQVEISDPLMKSLNIAILALLALTILGNRHEIENVAISLANPTDSILMTEFPDSELIQRLETAKEIYLVGTNLARTLQSKRRSIEKALSNGCKVKALVCDPDGVAYKIVAKRKYYKTDSELKIREEKIKAEIIDAISEFRLLKKETKGNLILKKIEFPLGRGGFFLDLEAQNAVIYMWDKGFQTNQANLPKYVLQPKDGIWFDHFKEEVTRAWQVAKNIPL
jgi:hypothetical protein